MDSIGKYMLEIILHQHRTPKLLKQTKLMQIQEDHSNPIRALNVDSLKDDSVVIQNPCSETEDKTEDSFLETASSKLVKESSLNSATKDVHAIKYKMSKAKERCMTYFRSLHSHLQVLSKEDLKGTRIEHGFKRAFMSLFGQDVNTFTSTMLLNVDHLKKQLDKDEFQEDGSMTAFWGVNNQFQEFTDSQYDRRVNKRLMQTQESKIDMGKAVNDDLVVTKSSGTESEVQDDNNRSRNDTDADDADIRPIYDEEPMAKVQLTAECNIFSIGQQHTEQPEIINEGTVDQYTWTHFLRSKDETPKVLINSPRLVQRGLQAQVRVVQTDKGTEFWNQTLHAYFAVEGILYQTSVARTPEQNSVVEKRNRTLTMASDQNSSDPAPECQTMASDQNSSNPALECQTTALNHDSLSPAIQRQEKVTQADRIVTTSNELDLLFSLMFDELLNGSSNVVSKSSAVSATDAPIQHHPLEQVIGNPSQPVRTRRQLESDAEMCMFALTFASQVDVNHNVSKPVTQHYLPKKSEFAFAKPDHMIASSSSRNSSKNMPRFSLNDMVYNHYLDEAKKKTQERDRNSKPSVMTPARF
uniref:Retrovirus-related Pol polyprotein from transposon TNT 1-94 n=1 Tax=Tanacetum cinerariifolium TaxID=118510 RepID=A0A6L2LPN8_TANCI|nr:retrovirus-related Pol polyprotein from transposon TNT 1-94 [Tanacetum cinerariifolium]